MHLHSDILPFGALPKLSLCEFVAACLNIDRRKWDKTYKTSKARRRRGAHVFPASAGAKQQLFKALSRCYPETLAYGPKGAFAL